MSESMRFALKAVRPSLVLGLAASVGIGILVGALVPGQGRAQELLTKTIVGQVVNESGTPLAGEPVCSQIWAEGTQCTTTDAEGRYSIVVGQVLTFLRDGTLEWPAVLVGKEYWEKSRYQRTSYPSDDATNVRSVLKDREAARGAVLSQRGAALAGVQVCAGSEDEFYEGRGLRAREPGVVRSGLICTTTSRKGRYRLLLAEKGLLFVWDRRFVPLTGAATLSPLAGKVRPGKGNRVRAVRVRQSAPITISGSTGLTNGQVCVSGGDGRQVMACTNANEAAYRLQIRPWVLASNPSKRQKLQLGVRRTPLQSQAGWPVAKLQAKKALRLRPGSRARISWGAISFESPTSAVCLSDKDTAPPATGGYESLPAWGRYCAYLDQPLGGNLDTQEPLFLRRKASFRVAYSQGDYQPVWLGGDGSWRTASVYEIAPGKHVSVGPLR